MSGLFIFVGCIAAAVALVTFIWIHRDGKLARGLGAASQQYNDYYQVGQAPQIVTPTSKSPSADSSDPLDQLRADLRRRNRARRAQNN